MRPARTLKTAQGKDIQSEAEAVEESSRKRWKRSEANKSVRGSTSHLNSLRNGGLDEARSSEEERRVDARALIAEEGRDKLRKAAGSCK